MKKGIYVLIIVLFFVVLIAAGFIAYFASEFSQPAVAVPARSLLEVHLSGRVDEVAPSDFVSTFIMGLKPLTVYDIWMNFRKAKVDDRIQAILLRLGYIECDWAKAADIREAVLDFRRSGKKVYAFIEEAPQFDMEYYIATACDRIVLQPLGWLGITGIGGYVPFFKGLLDKLGVEAEFEHIAEFKTAYNSFTEKGFTPAHREEMEGLYADIFDQYVKAAAKARGKTEAEYKALINKGLFQGDQAKAAGLVDDCLYEDELGRLIQGRGEPLGRISFFDYADISPSSLGLQTGRNVALIYGVGAILTGESLPEVMGAATVARWLRAAREDRSIAAIIFRVDSPGGSSVGADIIWREVALAKKVKPVIVSMSDLAGSGGYWIAMGATKIVAQPQTLTGSIGVLAGKFSLAGLFEKLGISAEKLTFGDKADLFSMFRPFTADERRVIFEQISWTYDQFLSKAAEGRGLTKEQVNAAGRGRVWTGRQAKELRLVDELGGLTMAVGLAKKAAGIPADEDVRFIIWPKKKTFWESLFTRPALGIDLKTAGGLEKVRETLRLMHQTNFWALMPFWAKPQ